MESAAQGPHLQASGPDLQEPCGGLAGGGESRHGWGCGDLTGGACALQLKKLKEKLKVILSQVQQVEKKIESVKGNKSKVCVGV